MARKKGSGEKQGNWMDTYGDMVTLLLTFFVMLYASSSFDEAKWQQIVQSFTSKGDIVNSIVAPENPESKSDLPFTTDKTLQEGENPQTFDELYQYLVNYVDKNGLKDKVEVEKGAANIYIRFQDQIFFAPDRSVLLDTGKDILSNIGVGIKAVDDKIRSILICGHTAVASGSKVDDAELSAMRSVSVLNYLETNQISQPSKMVSHGYGQYRPIAPNDTEENRRKNRRVEIIIIRNDANYNDPAVMNELINMSFGSEYVDSDSHLPVAGDNKTTDTTTKKSNDKK